MTTPTKRQAKSLAERNLKRAEMLCDRLHKFAMGMKGKRTDNDVIKMSAAQVRAALGIIDRAVPILKSQELHITDHTQAMSTKDLQTKLSELLTNQPELIKLAAKNNTQLAKLLMPPLEGEIVNKSTH